MAYEWRKNHLYYYRKVRENGHVRSAYAGPARGPITQCAAQLDRIERERRALARMDAEDEADHWAKLASPPPALLELEAQARAAVAAALHAAGYHQHKRGEWRKIRANKDENDRADDRAGSTARPADGV